MDSIMILEAPAPAQLNNIFDSRSIKDRVVVCFVQKISCIHIILCHLF